MSNVSSCGLKVTPLMSDLENFIYRYIYPVQFIVTVIGNSLVISVLLSSQMKNRANHLLALLALCDVLVLATFLPHFFASFDILATNSLFRVFFFDAKRIYGSLCNWFSAAAIWFVLAVSIERLLIIKFPFRSLNNYNKWQIISLGSGILLITFLLTSYNYVTHTCLFHIRCNKTLVIPNCISNLMEPSYWARYNMTSPVSDFTRSYIRISILLHAVFAVIMPIFAVALINISLIRLLKRRNTQELISHSVNMNSSQLQEQERRMTTTVVAIVTCFSLTQGPSALVYFYDLFIGSSQPRLHHLLSIFTNSLVLTGKTMNFVLFCLTSSTFRRRLSLTMRIWISMLFYCDKKKALLSTRSMSRSMLTQKTSVMNSPSTRVLPRKLSQVGRVESFNLQTIRKDDSSTKRSDEMRRSLLIKGLNRKI